MPAAKDILTATQENGKSFLDTFKEHCNGVRIDTKNTVLNLLRKNYPEHHITEAEEGRISLLEFADAGHAMYILDSDEESFNATRKWRSVGERLEKKLHPGKLSDDYRFARFQYIWGGKEFLLYFVVWKDMLESQNRIFYILSPRNEGNIVEGHCVDSDELVLAAGKWTSQLHEEIFVFDNGYWEKSKDLWKAVEGSSWEDVILDPEMKKSLIEDVQGFFDNQKLYADFAVPWKRGIILHGVPGNGKTVSIKALMSSLYGRGDHIPSLYVKSFADKCNGEEYSIRRIFQQARSSAPCLLIFEDLDSLVGDDVRSYFLNEVDGLESNDGILMIGSTNHLDRLDPAIAKRPSRFDRKYHFKLPGEEERSAYTAYWRKKLLKNDTVVFPEELCPIVAQLTEGFSFAYLKELFVMALLSLVRGHKFDDFEIIDKDTESEEKKEEANTKAASDCCGDSEKAKVESETCQCSKKCEKCGLLKEQEARKQEEEVEKKEEVRKARTVMPTIDIPDHLVDNLLLRVIKHQIRILHSEMDNTEEEQWPSGRKTMGGEGDAAEARARMMMMQMRRRRC
ncbi:proteasome-activating nucleotidase [Lindgomyces ingoldianus]|uniref:Proteasome-activating nucleotidase n=1 Tax=Lindgomyces ingoldianus TaxID=673940 RepID=A0ACB6QX33_9PLEO|nr:proteasome-activating nucleotidase [Lindgomyces ingoldianus]KAF2471070.1 proteasome-activating nucleotidase [Lindgomyces ingoldianus]